MISKLYFEYTLTCMALESERSFLESVITVATVASHSIYANPVFPAFMCIFSTFIDI